MYIPPLFREDRKQVLQQLMRQHSLATLVTVGDDGLIANHLPLIYHPDCGEHGTLRGHMARANSQWKTATSAPHALAIFQGPSSYVTPSWYPSKADAGKVVPTYNYAVVHAHGPLRIVEDPDALLQHLHSLTNQHESAFHERWSVNDAPPDFIRGLLNSIVGIELPIVKLEGKWKVSQNRSLADREGVARGLRSLGEDESRSMADLIEEQNSSS